MCMSMMHLTTTISGVCAYVLYHALLWCGAVVLCCHVVLGDLCCILTSLTGGSVLVRHCLTRVRISQRTFCVNLRSLIYCKCVCFVRLRSPICYLAHRRSSCTAGAKIQHFLCVTLAVYMKVFTDVCVCSCLSLLY